MSDFLEYLQSQHTDCIGVSLEAVEDLLKDMPEILSASDLNMLVGFASKQVGIWEAEWMYSPSNAPLLSAKKESEQWSRLLEFWIENLSKLVPDAKDQLERAHHKMVLQCHMSKSIDYCNGNLMAKLVSVSQAKLAIALNRFGITGPAEHLYMLALYPKGTVGRAT